jgi:hypothetical protein
VDRLTGKPYSSQLGQPFDLSVNGPALTTPPQPLNNGAIDTRFPSTLNTLLPYNVAPYLSASDKTGDIVHRFFQEQSQINGGLMNQFITWSDNPGLVMSYFNAANLPDRRRLLRRPRPDLRQELRDQHHLLEEPGPGLHRQHDQRQPAAVAERQ